MRIVKLTPETDQNPVAQTRSWADRVGIVLSALCVVHCAATPVLLLFLPAIQVTAYHSHFHEILLFVLPVLALLAFIPGYRRHRDVRVLVWGTVGVLFITLGAHLLEGWILGEVVLSVTGSLVLIRAHLMNRKLCACCGPAGHAQEKRDRLFTKRPKIKSPTEEAAPSASNSL